SENPAKAARRSLRLSALRRIAAARAPVARRALRQSRTRRGGTAPPLDRPDSARSAAWSPPLVTAGGSLAECELLAACPVQRPPRRPLRRVPRRRFPSGALRARGRVLHPGRVERGAPASLVVLRQLEIEALVVHPSGHAPGPGPGIEPGAERN